MSQIIDLTAESAAPTLTVYFPVRFEFMGDNGEFSSDSMLSQGFMTFEDAAACAKTSYEKSVKTIYMVPSPSRVDMEEMNDRLPIEWWRQFNLKLFSWLDTHGVTIVMSESDTRWRHCIGVMKKNIE